MIGLQCTFLVVWEFSACTCQNYYWSVAGNTRAKDKTDALRASELPGLQFLKQHRDFLKLDNRDSLVENPETSAMWTKSPMQNDSSFITHKIRRIISMCFLQTHIIEVSSFHY